MRHLLRYLRGTTKYGLLFYKNDHQYRLEAWTKADWGLSKERRWSPTEYRISYCKTSIIWTSKSQTSNATSICEAEFLALFSAVPNAVWFWDILQELELLNKPGTVIRQDNLRTVSWISKMQVLWKVRHVGIRYHNVRDAIDLGPVKVLYIPSEKNKADS